MVMNQLSVIRAMNRKLWSLLFLLVLLIAGGISMMRPPQPWWRLGNALWITSLITLVRLQSLTRKEGILGGKAKWLKTWQPMLTDFFCLMLVFAACTFMCWPAAEGIRPNTGDHPLHFFRFWYFVTYLAPQHRLYGWSNLWFGGEPVGYLYPFGSSVWAAIVYWCGLRFLSLDQAYAVAVWLAYFIEGAAIYFSGKYIFSRSAGTIASLMAVTDVGAYTNMGGWHMTAVTGVWPNTLSIAFSLLALIAFLKLLETGDRRLVGWFSLAAGISLLLHPLQIINLPILVGTAIAAYVIRGQINICRKRIKEILSALLLTALVAALWVLPFMSAKDYTFSDLKVWKDLAEMGEALQRGSLYPGMWVFTAVLGFIGGLALIAASSPVHLVVGLLFFGYLFLGSNEFGAFVASLTSADTAGKIEYLRFATLLRPFWAMSAGWVICTVIKAAGGAAPRGQPAPGRVLTTTFLQTLAVLLIVPPLLFAFCYGWYAERDELIRDYFLRGPQEGREQLVQWLENKYAETQDFFRVALYEKPHYHFYFDLATQLPVPVHNLNFSPVTGFRYQLETYDPEVLEALSVRYVLATEDMEAELLKISGNAGPEPELRTLVKFGAIYVNEFIRWNPQRFAVVEGSGSVQVAEFNDEKVVLIAAPGASGKLRLGVTYFDRWEASRDGVTVPVYRSRVGTKNESAFITVDLQPGRYEFRFVRRWPEKAGLICFLAGVAGVLAVLIFGKRSAAI